MQVQCTTVLESLVCKLYLQGRGVGYTGPGHVGTFLVLEWPAKSLMERTQVISTDGCAINTGPAEHKQLPVGNCISAFNSKLQYIHIPDDDLFK